MIILVLFCRPHDCKEEAEWKNDPSGPAKEQFVPAHTLFFSCVGNQSLFYNKTWCTLILFFHYSVFSLFYYFFESVSAEMSVDLYMIEPASVGQ